MEMPGKQDHDVSRLGALIFLSCEAVDADGELRPAGKDSRRRWGSAMGKRIVAKRELGDILLSWNRF